MNINAPHATLGADLRALRKARGVTLVDLAARLGRSVGWVSQVERDISSPSIDDLRTFAKTFASIGGFVSGDKYIMDFLRYNLC